MKFTAALVALTVAPVVSFSYLDNLSKPATAQATAVADPPFFFTNGVKDEPATSSFDAPAPTSAKYLENLNAAPAASAPTGGNAVGSYLDNLNAPAASAPTGSGMSSYLDALPAQPATTGAGMTNYAESLNQAGAASFSTPAFVPAPAAGVPANAAPTSAGYLSNLNTGADANPSGAGISGYLDALPRAPPTIGGAGIPSYKDSLPTAPAMIGGPGIPDYKDSLSAGGGAAPVGGYAVSGSSNFAIGSITGKFDFSFEADANIVNQIKTAGDRKMTLTGKVNSVSYN